MQKINILEEVPYIHNTKELSMWIRPLYIIENYTQNYDDYNNFRMKLLNVVRGCYPIKKCREYPIRFKFYAKDKKEYTLQLRHFYINVVLWNPFVELHGLDVLDESFILDCENNIPNIDDYINYKLIMTLRDYHVKSTTVNNSISHVLYNLRLISIDFSIILGLNFSAKTFLDMYEKNEEIRDIMEVHFAKNLQPHEIEQELQELQDREIDIYKAEHDNPIGVILRAKTGVKTKQFAEFTISEGLKPSLDGVTIPLPIENSTLLKGLDRPSYLYLDALGSRKSFQQILIFNYTFLILMMILQKDIKNQNLSFYYF